MQIQKIFSDYYDDERLYSVLMDEYELALFSEAVEEAEEESRGGKRSLVGAGVGAAGALGAAYGLGKGSGWLNKKLANRREKASNKLVEKIGEARASGKTGKEIEKLQKKLGKLTGEGRIEKLAGKYNNVTTKEWIKAHPGKAAAIAAGVAAIGAGAGYGVSKLKGKKRDEE